MISRFPPLPDGEGDKGGEAFFMETFIFLTTGFEEVEALVTVDVLRRGGVDLKTVSLTSGKTVVGGHQIPVVADCMFDEVDFANAEMLILPGGTVKINEHNGLKKEVLAFAAKGKLLAAICAAPIVFGELGLLRGKKATCYPGYENYLDGAEITYAPVTVDGNMITGRAAGFTFDFALELLARLKGQNVADETARKMLLKN